MTAPEDFWLAMSRGGRVLEIDRVECLELLSAVSVGRVGYTTDDGPRILPVNFSLVDQQVVFRTSAFGEIARHALDRPVAFEVDDVDNFFQEGWSVLVTGRGELLTESELRRLQLGSAPEPWAEGPRTLFLKITSDGLSGRRVLPSGA